MNSYHRLKAPTGTIHVVPKGNYRTCCGQVPKETWKPSRLRCGTCAVCAKILKRFQKTGSWW